MKKTVVRFKVTNVSVENIRGQKAIVNELLKTKKTLSADDYKKVKQLQTAQKNLAKLKTKQRKATGYYAKKSLAKQIKKREKYVQQKFNKTFGIKQDKKTGKFKQSDSGKVIARITQRGTYQVEKRERQELNAYLKENLSDGIIKTYNEFLEEYLGSQDIKDTLREYGVYAHYSQFTDGTSAGWTRRVMNACGVSDTVTTEEFYEWLDNLAVGGKL